MQDAALFRASYSTVSILTTRSNNGSSQCCRGFSLADESIPTTQLNAAERDCKKQAQQPLMTVGSPKIGSSIDMFFRSGASLLLISRMTPQRPWACSVRCAASSRTRERVSSIPWSIVGSIFSAISSNDVLTSCTRSWCPQARPAQHPRKQFSAHGSIYLQHLYRSYHGYSSPKASHFSPAVLCSDRKLPPVFLLQELVAQVLAQGDDGVYTCSLLTYGVILLVDSSREPLALARPTCLRTTYSLWHKPHMTPMYQCSS